MAAVNTIIIVDDQAQLSKCAQLHVAAEETQERVKKMKADFLRRTDEINQLLLEKHKIEVSDIVVTFSYTIHHFKIACSKIKSHKYLI